MSFQWSEESQKFTMFEEGIDIFNRSGLFKISEDQHANFESEEINANKSIQKNDESYVEDKSNQEQRLRQDEEKGKKEKNEEQNV